MNKILEVKKLLAVAAAAAMMVTATGCGLFSDPTATLVLPKQVAVGAKAKAEGAYSEEKAGLEVELRTKGGKDPLATTTTDENGRYEVAFKIADVGPQKVLVAVLDEDDETLSSYRTLQVLGKSSVSATLAGSYEAAIGAKRTLKGEVEPAGEARTVVLETSADGEAFNEAGRTKQTKDTGTYSFRLDTSDKGERFYRVKVAASDTRAEAVSASQSLGVYDYKAAGNRYLKCVHELNTKNDEFDQLVGFAVRKGSAGRMAKRSADQVECMRGYTWPPSVDEYIQAMIETQDVDGDVWNRMSKAATEEEFDELSWEFSNDSASPTRVRSILGLPKRSG